MQNFEKQKQTNKKNRLEMWRKGTHPPNLALIRMAGSEKTGFTDDGRRTTDGRTTDDGRTDGRTTDDRRPRDDSSSAMQ